jgi:hypothetical protein
MLAEQPDARHVCPSSNVSRYADVFSTNFSSDHSRVVTPAAIAGVTRYGFRNSPSFGMLAIFYHPQRKSNAGLTCQTFSKPTPDFFNRMLSRTADPPVALIPNARPRLNRKLGPRRCLANPSPTSGASGVANPTPTSSPNDTPPVIQMTNRTSISQYSGSRQLHLRANSGV